MEVEVLATAAEAGRRAAALIAERLLAAVAARGRASVAFSGGRTPGPMFEALGALPMSWRQVHIFQTDERIVDADDVRSNLRALRAAFRDTDLPPAQLHPMLSGQRAAGAAVADAEAVADAAAEYERTLATVTGSPPVLDVVHLGLGADGHTASLVPGDRVLAAEADVAPSGPYGGLGRITLTLAMLDRARCRIWLVTDLAKRAVVARLLGADPGLIASRVRREDSILILDRDASESRE